MPSEDTKKTFLGPDQLDATPLMALPRAELLSIGFTDAEIDLMQKMPETRIKSMIPAVLAAGKARAKEIQNNMTVKPEIDVEGRRRCTYVYADGTRCSKYGTKDIPICKEHKSAAAAVGTHFRSPKLREVYNTFLNSPVKMRFDGEIAMMRTMLATFVERIDDSNINTEVVASVIAVSEKIANTIDKMAKLEKVTPEQLDVLLNKVVEIAAKYIPADKLAAFADEVGALDLDKHELVAVDAAPFYPSPSVRTRDAEVIDRTVQRDALVQVAAHLGVSAEDVKHE